MREEKIMTGDRVGGSVGCSLGKKRKEYEKPETKKKKKKNKKKKEKQQQECRIEECVGIVFLCGGVVVVMCVWCVGVWACGRLIAR